VSCLSGLETNKALFLLQSWTIIPIYYHTIAISGDRKYMHPLSYNSSLYISGDRK
jgi:hypothetical protein